MRGDESQDVEERKSGEAWKLSGGGGDNQVRDLILYDQWKFTGKGLWSKHYARRAQYYIM